MESGWRPLAACYRTDTSVFYQQESARGISVSERAISLCLSCTVSEQCLNYALKHEDYGFWAGTTAKDRKRIRLELGIELRRPEVRLLFATNDGNNE
jgi:WhiB family redox-sensing transcriptional regulator